MAVSTIAIDGPAGSGKSTLGKLLAEKLGYLYFDSGVMYRAVTLAALERGLAVGDEEAVTRLAGELLIDVRSASAEDGRGYDVIVDGKDVTWDIRLPEVDANVSIVSAYAGVRQALTGAQRKIGLRGRVVMVGRDIGTVVMPEADLKIYLNASLEERARRRSLEINQRGGAVVLEEVLSSMITRDQIDSTRAVAPLRAADDAYILESDGLNIDQVLHKALSLVEKG